MDSLNEKYKKTFTKEYILELQNIHQKEKNELLFKISSLENALDRIKISFNDQLKSMQKEQAKNDKNYIAKISQIKSGLNLKYKTMENEKDLQISLLKEELDKENVEHTNKDMSKELENLNKIKGTKESQPIIKIKENDIELLKNELDITYEEAKNKLIKSQGDVNKAFELYMNDFNEE